jgi:AcrR family transcriptional regulator
MAKPQSAASKDGVNTSARERKREKIQRAAADVLVELGLRQATMEDIALRLGTSKILLYRYFETKDDLLDAVLSAATQYVLEPEYEEWPGLKPAMARTLKRARDNPNAFLLLFRVAAHDREFCHHSENVREVLVEVTRARLVQLNHTLRRDKVLLAALAEGIITFLVEATTYWLENGAARRDADWIAWVSSSALAMAAASNRTKLGPLPPALKRPRTAAVQAAPSKRKRPTQ